MTRMVIPGGAKKLGRRSALFGVPVFCGVLALFLLAGAFRLWPRISGQHLPFSLIWPFARPLLAAALELSFLVSVPIAMGALASMPSTRELGMAARSVSALSTCLLVVCLGTLSFGISSSLDDRSASPGQLAAELVASARESCVESAPPAEVNVPLLDFSWVCVASQAPLLRGRAPVGKQAKFEAAAITLEDDLKRISLARFSLALPSPSFPIRVHVERATLRGLPPWGRSRRMPLALRASLFVLSSALAAYGVGRLAARALWLRPWAGALLGASISGALWFALTWLERREPRPLTYLVLPGTSLASLAIAAVGLALGRRLWLHWGQPAQNFPRC